VKEVISNMQCKQVMDTSSTAVLHSMPARGESSATARGYHYTQPANPNLQLSYYQAMGYGPTLLAGGVPYGSWPEVCPLAPVMNPCMVNTDQTVSGEMPDGVRD
jgi:hypothetical protein